MPSPLVRETEHGRLIWSVVRGLPTGAVVGLHRLAQPVVSLLRSRPSRVRILTLLGALVLASSVSVVSQVWTAPTAAASDGRRADAVAEVTSYYRHFLGRAPDVEGLMHYLDGVDRNCRQGVIDAGWAISNSGEAQRFLWANDRKANSVYAGFLDRLPDPDGWHAYKGALDRGAPWEQLTRNALWSPEFGNRLNSICAGARSYERVDCRSIAAQGPPSASIPPQQQRYFSCSSSSGWQLSKCSTSILWATTGVSSHALDWRAPARLVLKKAGPVMWALTAHDVVQAYRDC